MSLLVSSMAADISSSSDADDASTSLILQATEGGALVLPSGFLFGAEFARAGGDLVLQGAGHETVVIRDFFAMTEPPRLETDSGARIEGALAARLAGSPTPGQYAASDGAGSASEPIGKVAEITGEAATTHIDGTRLTLAKDMPVFEGDVIETAEGAAVKVVFIDESTFAVGENARMVLDELVFDRATLEGSSSFSVLEGVFVFVSGGIAENNPDQMVVKTPVATMGIRGTAVAVQAAEESEQNLIILLPEQAEDGQKTTGSVKVKTDGGEVVLDEPNEATALDSVFAQPSDTFYALPEDIAFLIRRLQGAIPDSLRYLKSDIVGENEEIGAALGQIVPAAGGNNDDAPDEVIQVTNGDPLAGNRFGGAPPSAFSSFSPPSPDLSEADSQHEEPPPPLPAVITAGVLNINVDEDELQGGAPDGDTTGLAGTFTGAQIAGLAGADPASVKVSFNPAIDGVDTGLDSLGFDIVFTLDGENPTELSGVADGRTVFTLVQDAGADEELGTADDVFTFTLLDSVDHTPNGVSGSDAETIVLNLNNVFATTDSDDVTTVIGTLSTVTIENDVPANNSATVNLNVDEDELPGGNSDDDGVTSSGTLTSAQLGSLVNTADAPLRISLNAAIDGANTGLDSLGFDVVFDVVSPTQLDGVADGRTVFTLVQQAGEDETLGTADDLFTFTLLDQIDHVPLGSAGTDSETIALNLTNVFIATDFDGESIVINTGATVTIENDVPADNDATVNLNVDEDELPGGVTDSDGTTTSGTFTGTQIASLVAIGADEPITISLNAAIDGASTGLDSLGFDIAFDVISATRIDGVADGRTIFTLVQDDGTDNVLGTADDVFTFTLLDQVDHTPLNSAGTDSETIVLQLTNVFAATDFDGDRLVIDAGATVTIENDISANSSATVNLNVDEDELTGGVTDNDGTTAVAAFTGAQIASLVFTGSDVPLNVSLNAAIDGVDTGLDSKGFDIRFDVISATRIDGIADGRTVFTLVQDDGADNTLGTADDVITFTLLDQVDHTPLGTAGTDTETIALQLTNVFAATDFDGDRIVIDAGATVTIENDIPANNSATVNLNVDEDELAGGITDNDGTPASGIFTGAQIASLVSPGADESVKVSLNAAVEGVNTGLDSKGFDIVFDSISATRIDGVADGRTVFTLVQAAGTDETLGTADDVFTFTLLDQVDHTPLGTAGTDTETIVLQLTNVFAATDFDGDRIVIDAGATVTIENDIPENNSATVNLNVDEDELAGGITDNDGTTAIGTFTGAQIANLVAAGADEPVKVSLNGAIDGADTGLDSLGSDITFDAISATRIDGVADGRTVFSLVQDDGVDNVLGTADDVFTFTLLDQVDHTPNNAASSDTDTIILSLANVFAATDFDGDRIVIDDGATVTIENDVPVNFTPEKALIGNTIGGTSTATLNVATAVGADAPATIVFAGTLGSITALTGSIGDGEIAQLRSGGQDIWLAGAGTDTLVAFVDSNGDQAYDVETDLEVFTATLDAGGDSYSILMHGTIDNGVAFETATGTTPAVNREWFAFNNLSGPEANHDLLFTGLVPGEDSINISANGLGSETQTIGAGTGVRIDFVTGANTSAADFDDFAQIDYAGHYKVNEAGFYISQIQGNETAAAKISVFDEATEAGPQGSIATDLTNDPAKAITAITVIDRSTDAVLLDHVGVDTSLDGLVVNFDEASGNKFVTVSGLLVDYEVLITTADGFERLLIENFNSSAGFDIGGVVVGTTITNDPIAIDLPTTLVDSDGDVSSGSIDMTLLPQLTGDENANTLNGAAGAIDEILVGNGGNDTLNGGGGDDVLNGGNGNDLLIGGTGINKLTGGAGTDQFLYQSSNEGVAVGTDQVFNGPANSVTDFQSGVDRFAFLNTAFGFGAGTTGSLAQIESSTGANLFSTISGYDGTGVTEDTDQPHFIFDPTAHTLYFDDDVTSPGYTVIAEVQAGASVTATDIQIGAAA